MRTCCLFYIIWKIRKGSVSQALKSQRSTLVNGAMDPPQATPAWLSRLLLFMVTMMNYIFIYGNRKLLRWRHLDPPRHAHPMVPSVTLEPMKRSLVKEWFQVVVVLERKVCGVILYFKSVEKNQPRYRRSQKSTKSYSDYLVFAFWSVEKSVVCGWLSFLACWFVARQSSHRGGRRIFEIHNLHDNEVP